MPIYNTEDGEYLFAIDDHNDTRNGKPQWVVYDKAMNAIFDRHGYEASRGGAQPPSSPPPDAGFVPGPVPPWGSGAPIPADGGGIRVIQVTDASDGDFVPRMYAYWPNAFVTGSRAFVFAGHVDGQPRFFDVDLPSGRVTRLGPLIGFMGTTEGWYWDASGWVYLIDGTRLRRVSPFTNEAPIVFDINDSHPGCVLWQAHSSDDGQTHSATVQRVVNDGAYPAIGTVVFHKGKQEYFPAQGVLDESQIDASGRWLVIKEDDDNRIIDLETRETRVIRDADGAVGHSDCGDGILVGEDNIHGACVLWDLRGPLVPSRRRELFSTWNLGYISIRAGKCLHSANEYLALVVLDGAGEVPILNHAEVHTDYDDRIKANLDPTGRVACYMAKSGGRRDVYLAVLP